jgi:hypothetical protein
VIEHGTAWERMVGGFCAAHQDNPRAADQGKDDCTLCLSDRIGQHADAELKRAAR